MKKILITGASGFIGSFLVEKALEKGWEVWAGIRKTSSREYLKDSHIRFIDLDYSNKGILKQQIESHVAEHGKWDYIIHNAGVTKCTSVSDFYKVNYRYTVHFIEALEDTETVPEKFILMSSLSAMFPETAYGASKLEAEQHLEYCSSIPYVIMRPTGVYGPREKDYYMMLKAVRSGFDVTAGFKPQRLTFVYVADLVQAVFLALESNVSKRIYTVSDGNIYTDSEYAGLVKKVLDKQSVVRIKVPLFILYIVSVVSEFFGKMLRKPSTLNRDKYKIMKQRDWSCSDQPLVDDLGYKPEYDLEKGLKASVEWYKQNEWL
ncbi:MAG: NAD(P)-dependent oxidoreductase [Candidatus Azobacteroides sp.]|nr:NAD(P)-dependent oxidoreductase [Candidatus Azobacteroides sp.]